MSDKKKKLIDDSYYKENDLNLSTPKKNVREIETFVLRVWHEKTNGKSKRYSLVHTRTGAKRGFATLAELTRFLEQT